VISKIFIFVSFCTNLDSIAQVPTCKLSTDARGFPQVKPPRSVLLRSAVVDLNQLYFDHQLSAMGATRLPTAVLRREANHVASAIAGQIEFIQRGTGALAALGWGRLAGPTHGRFSKERKIAASTRRQAANMPAASPLREESENPDRGHANRGHRPSTAFQSGVSTRRGAHPWARRTGRSRPIWRFWRPGRRWHYWSGGCCI